MDDRTNRVELQDQIAQLLIESSLPLNEFLNPKEETIVNKDDDIFAAAIECYSVNKLGKEDESCDEEEEEVERIEDAETLRIVERLKLWKLQRGTDQDIRVPDRIEREIIGVRSSTAHQTTILRFLEPK